MGANIDDNEVREATQFLHNQVIPNFIQELNMLKKINPTIQYIIELLHRKASSFF